MNVEAGEAMLASLRASSTTPHEYVHHLREMVPGLDRKFRAMHRRRTTAPSGVREPIEALKENAPTRGRPDRCADEYFALAEPSSPDAKIDGKPADDAG